MAIINDVKNERLLHNVHSDMYGFLQGIEDDLNYLIRDKPQSLSSEAEECLKYIRRRPAITKIDIARFIGMNPHNFNKCVNRSPGANGKPLTLPGKYVPKLVEFLALYGYKS